MEAHFMGLKKVLFIFVLSYSWIIYCNKLLVIIDFVLKCILLGLTFSTHVSPYPFG